jgi:TrmH family RNA methyltransferase
MDIIKSKDNSKIKYIRSLSIKKNRDNDNAFVVEGIKFVWESVEENIDIKFVLISESISGKKEILELIQVLNYKQIDYFLCDDKIFDGVAETINAQGILSVATKKIYSKDILLNDYKFVILCDRIQDPGNLGTIVRTSDAFGPAAVILNKGCVDLYNPKVVRATAGSMFRVPFVIGDENEEILKYLKNAGFKIISAVVNSEYSFEDVDKFDKICIVIGNEGQGISQEITDASDLNITIKMNGRAESLNASIAAGICIYEIRKKLL